MGKLGKKARKFVKKKLPAVLKRQRKQKSMFNKRKSSSRGEHNVAENQQTDADATTTGRKPIGYDLLDVSLDIFSSEENYDMPQQDASDTDEFLSEDPQFVIFLQDHIKDRDSSDNEDMSDDKEESDQDLESENDCAPISNTRKLLRSLTINNWCQMVKEQNKVTLLPSLINAYHAACHYGADPTDVNVSVTPPIIQNKEAFYSILMFMLYEGDQLFRGILGISADCKLDAILKLKNSSKWENVKPMVKSYLKSSLFLLNQFTDTDILAYALSRLRASLIFFSAFPALQDKLIEVSVHLWATGSGSLSACSFVLLRGIASFLGDDSYDKCLKKTYKAILSCSKIVSPARLKHLEYLKSSFVELCSIDFQISAKVVVASTQKLAKIVQLGLQTKQEALRMICSWEYVLCIDIWVNFVQSNIKDIDLHAILSTLIQVILGVAKLFASQRYLPLKVKCVHWLNVLSSSENFVPTSSLALDILENSNVEEEGKTGKGGVDFSTALKVPKHWLKSQGFQEKSVLAAVELLSAHFLQWSHHISFPELATIPIIRLKQFHDKSTNESLRRTVKRLIDQVEKNVEFVQRKRDDVSFSPKDIASAELFLQMEKHSGNMPFIQYYKSVLQNAATKKVSADDQMSRPENKKQKAGKRKLPDKTEDVSADGEKKSGNTAADPSMGREQGVKIKKRKA